MERETEGEKREHKILVKEMRLERRRGARRRGQEMTQREVQQRGWEEAATLD